MLTWASLIDLAVGRRCLDCDRVGESWCDPCLEAMVDVHKCVTPGGVTVMAATRYGGSVRTAVVRHKERGQLALAVPLGRLLAAATLVESAAVGRRPPALVPVPSTRASSRARGHDHARRLAKETGAVRAMPVHPSLRWDRQVNDQAGLSAQLRRDNVAGAMVATGPTPTGSAGTAAWLVDDVMTTGATLDEGVRALRAAGWNVLGVSVVASVDARRALARGDLLR